MKRFASILMGVLVAKFAGVAAAGPLPSAFSFQGRLSTEGVPVNGTADFEFTLWDADVGGSMLGSLNAIDDVSIVEGLFTVQLDFGMNPFNGQAVWLEIATRSPAGGGAFQTLSPRQAILPAPYS